MGSSFDERLERELAKIEEEKKKKKKQAQKSQELLGRYSYLPSSVSTTPKTSDDIAPVRTVSKKDDDIIKKGQDMVERYHYTPAPIKTTTTTKTTNNKKEEEEEKPWYKSGLFEDGYDFGDVTKTILGVKDDTASLKDLTWGSAKRGYYNAIYGEESYDAMLGRENEKEAYEQLLAGDEYQFTPGNDLAGGVSGAFELLGQQARQLLNPRTMAYVGTAAGTVAVAGQAGPQALAPEEILTVPAAAAFGFATGSMHASYEIESGLAYNEMLEAGISEETAKKVATAVGGVNAGLEALQVDELLDAWKVLDASGTTKTVTKRILKELADRGIDVAKETAQEVAQEGVTIAGTQFASKKDKGEWAYSAEDVADRLADTAKSSALSFGIMNVPATAKNTISIAKDSTKQKNTITLTENEQKVVEKVYQDEVAAEQKVSGKVSQKKKQEILNGVIERMEKGYISTDTIEEVLGGDSYKAYKDTLDSETALKDEQKALQEEQNTLKEEYTELNKKVLTGEVQDRREEIKARQTEIETRIGEIQKSLDDPQSIAKRNLLKAQLDKDVYELTKSDKLRESYFEVVRSKEKYKADLSKYEGKEREIIKQVMDSGLADNSNQTHEFWDLMAKLSSTGDTTISLADSAQILEMVKAEHEAKGVEFDASKFEGQRIDGYISDKGIVLNAETKRALNFVVGHEITHKLEKTKNYSKLQRLVLEYAKSEYESRFNARAGQYSNKFAADEKFKSKVDMEVTGDLVGDYLFSDKDFVTHLAKDQNVFQQVWNEIKYMAKIATAGSEQAKQLEKVKREFERAWRESQKNTANSGAQYSIETLPDGKKYVRADRQVIFGNDPDSWSEQVESYINGKIRNGENISLVAEDGEILVLTADTAGKISSNKTNHGTTMDDEEFSVKANAGVHIDELAQISVNADPNKKPVKDRGSRHGAFAEGGWTYRYAFFRDFDNRYYRLKISAAKGADGNVVYNIGDIEERSFPKVTGSSAKGGALNGKASFDTKVPQEEEFVNGKFSVSDSDGKQLTKEQQEYFKDSVVRDENGNLKVMYHGTSKGGHTVFDTWGKSNYGLFGTGTYFTDSKTIAESYTNKGKGNNKQVYESYLNIKNPLDMDAQADPAEWAKAFDEVDFPESGTNEDFYRAVEEYYADQYMPKWEVAEIVRDSIEFGMGYDGITHIGGGRVNADSERHRVYIAFESEQIKNTDNVSPTTDPDIRYSLSTDSDGNKLSAEQSEYFKESKAVDANGNLQRVYHGTRNADFTVFKRNVNFFTDSKEMADSYSPNGAMYEGYVNITKPYEIDAAGEKWSKIPIDSDMKKFLQEYGASVFKEGGKWRTTTADIASAIEEAADNGDMDYDGIIIRNVDDTGSYYKGEGKNVATDYIVFNSNQFKNADNTKPTTDKDIRFSLSEAVEETKDLIAVHNLHTAELLETLNLSGLPSPSVAIIKAKDGHEKYGDVSLILPKDAIDPQTNNANRIYGSDAWTPTRSNAQVEYEVDYDIQRQFERTIEALSKNIANGVFSKSSVLGMAGIEDSTGLNLNEIAKKMSDYDAVQAAYIAENGGNVDVVYRTKEFDSYGNDALKGYVDKVGEQEVARLAVKMMTGERLTEEEIETAKDALVDNWVVKKSYTLKQKPELREIRIAKFRERLTNMRVEDFVRHAWEFYEDRGATTDEIDRGATSNNLRAAANRSDVEAWVAEKLQGLLSEPGIYNGKEIFTPTGKRRSFKETHWDYTAENIVRAMNNADARGANVWNVSGEAIIATATSEYKNIDEVRADKDRLFKAEDDYYEQIKDDISEELQTVTKDIIRTTEHISDNQYDEEQIIGRVIMEAAQGKKTVASVKRVFQKNGYRIGDAQAKSVLSLFDHASNVPTGYFEAKPQRVVGFDEVGVYVIPRNADVKLKQELLNRGCSIAEYDPDVEGDRQKVVNQFEEYKFSLSNVGETPKQYGRWNVYSHYAPMQETVSETESVAPYEDNWKDSFDSLTDDDAPPVRETAPVKEISTVQEKIAQKIKNTQAELDKNRQLREQSIKDYDEEIAGAQAELDSKKNQNTAAAQNLKRRIERLNRIKGNIDADYAKRISDLEARVEKLHSQEYSRAEHRRSKQEGYTKMWEDMIGDTSTWKDMPLGLQYKTKTLRRILRKVVKDANGNADINKADRIYDELETKYDHNEALLKRESQKLKESFFKLKLNHVEDTYAHMLGELRHNPDTTLTEDVVKEYYDKHKGKIDTKKVDTAITEARKTFDDLIVRVNKVLKEQGMKEIPYREGYFPHFTNPKQGWLAKLLNWKTVDTEIPTSIAGLTEAFKPQRSWQSFNKQRMGDATDYSLYQGLDTYIHGALDWIYHIEDLQKRRALENHIRYTHSEEGIKQRIEEIKKGNYDADEAQEMIDAVLKEANNPLGGLVRELMNRTNTLANKKSSMDRGMEDATNRKIYSTMTNLNNRVTSNMVVGSLSSALTNFIPIVQSWHQVSPDFTVRGLGDFVRSKVKDDGMIAKSDFLTNRLIEEENLYQTGWDKASDKLAFMMNVFDSITSQTVWRSKYLQNLKEGMSESQAIKDADQFAKNLIAGRSRGNMPTIFDSKNPLIKLFTAFQLEVANQYGYMFEDVPQDTQNMKRLVAGYATASLGAYLYNALYSTLVGRDAAFDPVGILVDLLRDLIGDDEEEEEDTADVLLGFAEDVAQQVPFVGGLLGGGRVPIQSALPYGGDSTPFKSMLTDVTEGNLDSFGKELLKPLYYLAMPVGGGQIKKAVEGLSMFSDKHPISGSYTDSGKLRFPVEDTLGNKVKAGLFGQYASENARYYFDNDIAPMNEKQIREYSALDAPIRDYWDYRDNAKELAKKADSEDATDDTILQSKYLNSVNDELNDLLKEEREVSEDSTLTEKEKRERINEIQQRFDELSKESYSSYQDVSYDDDYREGGLYARVGDRIYKQTDEGEWRRLSDEQVTKYEITKAAGNAEYATDGKIYYKWHEPENSKDDAEWRKMTDDQVTKYLVTKNADNPYYATNGTVHYRRDNDGEWVKISNKQLERQNEVTRSLGITPAEYWSKTDISFLPMSDGEYEYAYNNPENYALAKVIGGYDAYSKYSKDLGSIKSDYDANGKSISGSRKQKVADYINSLDADYYEKVILFKSQYTSYDDENYEIVEYLNNRDDISYEEMVAILTKLDFTVSPDGRVTWD